MRVDIDEAQLDQELDTLLASLPPDLEGQYIPAGRSWKDTLRKYHVVDGGRQKFLAGWNFPEDFDDDATECIGELGDRYWPGGVEMADNWGPWAKLFALTGIVAFMNLDKILGWFGPPPPAPAPETPNEEESPDGNTGA